MNQAPRFFRSGIIIAAVLFLRPLPSSAQDLIDGITSSSSKAASSEKPNPLDGLVSQMESQQPSTFSDEDSHTSSTLDRAIAVLVTNIGRANARLTGYTDMQRKIVLSRSRPPTEQERAADDDRKRAMRIFSGKLESARSLRDRASSMRERCLSRDPKYQLDHNTARDCERLLQDLRDGIGGLQVEAHNMDVAIASAGKSYRGNSAPAPEVLNPWDPRP